MQIDIFLLPPFLKVGLFILVAIVERAESEKFQAVGDEACALREWAEKYTFRPDISKSVSQFKNTKLNPQN